MQMRHQPAFGGERIEQVAVGLDSVDGGESQPRELGHMLENLPHQPAQPGRSGQVRSVAGEIDAGEDDFAIAALAQGAHLRHHLPHGHRARIAAPIGNDAEGAAMVAAILYRHEGAHAAFASVDRIGVRFAHRHDVADLDLLVIDPEVTGTPGLRTELFLVAQDRGDLGHVGKAPGLDLRCATRDHDARAGALAPDTPHALLRLPHRFCRHRAGVDDDGVAQAGRDRRAADDLRFEGVEPAAEGDDINAHGRTRTTRTISDQATGAANSEGSNRPSNS